VHHSLIGAAGVWAGFSATARGYLANETVNVGGIGCGGRFRHLMQAFKKLPGTRLVAVCDVWDHHLGLAKELAEKEALATKDYHELLSRDDIDAVVIASPDHWHVPMTIDACAAGKDVYVEKPLTHDVREGAAVIDAQNRGRRIVQVGTQQRSMPQFQKAFELIRAGRIGKIHKVHLSWNRNTPRDVSRQVNIDPKTVDWKRFLGSAPPQPFDGFRMRHWRWFWDFGGGILTDLMVHWLDVVHWFLDLDHPETAVTIGDSFQTKGLWETPDTIQTVLRYPDKDVQAYFEGTFISARRGAMVEFMGRDATLYLDRGRYEIHPELGKSKYEELVLGTKPRGADFDTNPDGELLHLGNWIDCVRSRKRPNCPAEAGVSAVTGAHLGNRAYRTGRTAHWDELAQ
jgi:predicted dehydrogenase